MKMSEAASENLPVKPVSVGGQLVIPVVAVVFTLYYFSTILDSPWTAQVSAFIIGFVLIALCLVSITKSGLLVARKQADLKIAELLSTPEFFNGRGALFAFTFSYILLIDWGGFTITTFIFLFLSMMVLDNGKRKLLAFLVAGAMSLSGYALFILAFDTRFPRGPFENMMEALLSNGI